MPTSSIGPLTPIFNERKRRGSIDIGNSPSFRFGPPIPLVNLELYADAIASTHAAGVWTSVPNYGSFGSHFDGSANFPSVTTLNGENAFSHTTNAELALASGPWLSDDIYDIYVLIKSTSPATNVAMFCQHAGTADVGRFNFGCVPSSGSRPATFFNNGASHEGLSSHVAFDNTPHVVRWYSSGNGNHYIQVDDNTAELVITGQTFTPLSQRFRIGRFQSGGTQFIGHIVAFLGCTSVQAPATAAACIAWLMGRAGI